MCLSNTCTVVTVDCTYFTSFENLSKQNVTAKLQQENLQVITHTGGAADISRLFGPDQLYITINVNLTIKSMKVEKELEIFIWNTDNILLSSMNMTLSAICCIFPSAAISGHVNNYKLLAS